MRKKKVSKKEAEKIIAATTHHDYVNWGTGVEETRSNEELPSPLNLTSAHVFPLDKKLYIDISEFEWLGFDIK